jgi:hypothetical protein
MDLQVTPAADQPDRAREREDAATRHKKLGLAQLVGVRGRESRWQPSYTSRLEVSVLGSLDGPLHDDLAAFDLARKLIR